MRTPLDDPIMADFVDQLAQVNALADESPGFVWRLADESGGAATDIRAFADDRILVNMSVWESIEALHEFSYRGHHAGLLRERGKWFEPHASRMVQSQLQVLKSELHPHFLFNTLHAISTLMHRDVGAADRMLARLSDLLRHSLEHIGQQETTLQAELEFLALYVEIEQMRFGDRLSVDVDAAPETLELAVPAFLLQPLVENAIRHAVAPRAAGGAVEIQASRFDDTLRIEVRDDGPGFPAGPARNGIGLSNTRARLEQLYGASHRFELANLDAPSQGALCRIELPARVYDGAPT